MGRLIATTQATLDGVIDPVADWEMPGGDHGDHSSTARATFTFSVTRGGST
jgi:hypothetical protein